MPSTIRRSEQLQKRLQRRNNSLKPADFTKVQTPVANVEEKVDPVEKSKAALSDLRKRIDERKKMSKLVNVNEYQERREDPIPELTGATFSESPMSQRQQPSSPKPSGGLKNFYTERKNAIQETMQVQEDKVPPSHIEVNSTNKRDDDTEVSEITTDVRIMSTKGAAYAERRMAGNVQMRLAKPALSTPTGQQLQRDININVNNLKDLGKAVEEAKMELQKEMSPVNNGGMRHGLPYESTDYRPSADEDEVSSWGKAIRAGDRGEEEHKEHFIADKNTASKLSKMVKEAYSYEGDVFIDATDVREEDLDGEDKVTEDNNDATPVEEEDNAVEQFHSSEQHEEKNDYLEMEDESPDATGMDHEDAQQDEEPPEEKTADFASNPAAMASDFFKDPVGFFKSFSSQVDNQLKSFQQNGLVSMSDMEGMLGILKRDVDETESKLPRDADEAVIFLGDEFEASVGLGDSNAQNSAGSNNEIEKMLESLKNTYNIGISKCGLDSDLIKENTKAIEKMVANLKNGNESPSDNEPETTEDDIDGAVFKELSAQRAEDDAPLTGANGVMLSINMPDNE